VADPMGPQPKGSKQFSYGWDDLAVVVELASTAKQGLLRPPSEGRPTSRELEAAPEPVHPSTGMPTDLSITRCSWDDLASVAELSAETGRLASTPDSYGKPGGPGLYGIKTNKHSDYLEHIVHALMRKGMDKGKATAIARGSIRRWMVKSKHPEVRAAAGMAETQEIAAQARAHAHAVTWDDLGTVVASVIEMAPPGWDGVSGVIDLISTAQNQAKATTQPRDQLGKFSTTQAAKTATAKKTAAAKGKVERHARQLTWLDA